MESPIAPSPSCVVTSSSTTVSSSVSCSSIAHNLASGVTCTWHIARMPWKYETYTFHGTHRELQLNCYFLQRELDCSMTFLCTGSDEHQAIVGDSMSASPSELQLFQQRDKLHDSLTLVEHNCEKERKRSSVRFWKIYS